MTAGGVALLLTKKDLTYPRGLEGPREDQIVYAAAERATWLARAGMCGSASTMLSRARKFAQGQTLDRRAESELSVAKILVSRCRI